MKRKSTIHIRSAIIMFSVSSRSFVALTAPARVLASKRVRKNALCAHTVEYEGVQWFRQLASEHAPEYEFRTLPKNSFISILMRRRSDIFGAGRGASESTPSPHIIHDPHLWMGLAIKSSSGIRKITHHRGYYFNPPHFRPAQTGAPSRILGLNGTGAVGCVLVCKPDRYMWFLESPSSERMIYVYPPSEVAKHAPHADSFVDLSQCTGANNFRDLIQRMYSQPDRIRLSWDRWLLESCEQHLHRIRPRNALRQLVSFGPFQTLEFCSDHMTAATAVMSNAQLVIRTNYRTTYRGNSGNIFRFCRHLGGGNVAPYSISDNFDFVVLLVCDRDEEARLRKIGIFSRDLLHERGYLADDTQKGRTAIYYSASGSLEKSPLRGLEHHFIAVDDICEEKLRDFVSWHLKDPR